MEREPQHTGEVPGRAVLPQRSEVKWPSDSRLAVLLTFDCFASEAFSPISFMATMYDFGLRKGVWYILELLEKLGVKATFHVPGATAEVYPRVLEALSQAGHDIAALGYRYEPHWDLSEEKERENIQRTASAIGNVLGRNPKGWRTPESRLTLNTLDLVQEAGFLWDSSMRNDELPYRLELEKGSLVEIPYGGYNNYIRYYGSPRPPLPPQTVFSIWHDELDVLYEESKRQSSMLIMCLHPTFHGQPAELDYLEHFITKIKELDGTWFARCSDVADWWTQNQSWS